MPSKPAPARKPATKSKPVVPARKTPAKPDFIDLTTASEVTLKEPDFWDNMPGSDTGKVLINRTDLEKLVRHSNRAGASLDAVLLTKLENGHDFTELRDVAEQLAVVTSSADELIEKVDSLNESLEEIKSICADFIDIVHRGPVVGLCANDSEEALETFKKLLTDLVRVLPEFTGEVDAVFGEVETLRGRVTEAESLTRDLVEAADLSDEIDTCGLN
jgi:hypothetical protein